MLHPALCQFFIHPPLLAASYYHSRCFAELCHWSDILKATYGLSITVSYHIQNNSIPAFIMFCCTKRNRLLPSVRNSCLARHVKQYRVSPMFTIAPKGYTAWCYEDFWYVWWTCDYGEQSWGSCWMMVVFLRSMKWVFSLQIFSSQILLSPKQSSANKRGYK